MRLTLQRLAEGFNTACGVLGLLLIATPILALLAGAGWLIHEAFAYVFGPGKGRMYFILFVTILVRGMWREWQSPTPSRRPTAPT